MADSEGNKTRIGIYNNDGHLKAFDMAFTKIFVQFPNKLQNHLKASRFTKACKFTYLLLVLYKMKKEIPLLLSQSQLKRLAKGDGTNSELKDEKAASTSLGVDLEKQLQAWGENPSWVDQTPEIKVGERVYRPGTIGF